MRKLGVKFPAVIDGFENTTELAYTGWPDRLYLIDAEGKVAYKSKPGPLVSSCGSGGGDQAVAAVQKLGNRR